MTSELEFDLICLISCQNITELDVKVVAHMVNKLYAHMFSGSQLLDLVYGDCILFVMDFSVCLCRENVKQKAFVK